MSLHRVEQNGRAISLAGLPQIGQAGTGREEAGGAVLFIALNMGAD